jgi:hypothetical protein
MCTLQDRQPQEKHKVVVAALAHLVALRRPGLGLPQALQHAQRAYQACLQAVGPAGEVMGFLS